mgnify:CR=1 FL=1
MAEKQTLRPSPTAILNPRLDVNFKALFTQGTKGSDTALRSFLSSVLGRKNERTPPQSGRGIVFLSRYRSRVQSLFRRRASGYCVALIVLP